LLETAKLASHNQNLRYILLVSDNFTKFIWARPMKNKLGLTLRDAFSSILDEAKTSPIYLLSDKAGETMGNLFQNFLKQRGIRHIYVRTHIKASIIERWVSFNNLL